MILRSYIDPAENRDAARKLPRLMVEGLLLGGSGLGVLALIFEIAADAFSVAAYQTLLAIHGASGHHDIAILAFVVLSIMLFFGIVPAYKAGAYIRPTAGGSGPLVEAIGPQRLRPRGHRWARHLVAGRPFARYQPAPGSRWWLCGRGRGGRQCR